MKRIRALWLVGLVLQSACSTPGPRAERRGEPAPAALREAEFEFEAVVFEPGQRKRPRGALSREAFQRALRGLPWTPAGGTAPQAEARERLGLGWEGEWLAEVEGGQVRGLLPLGRGTALAPEAEARLARHYLDWCERRGGGDCLGLLEDGPYLRVEDRRTLALALALGGVLEETREALAREVSAGALVATAVWTVGLYLTLWLLPEPSTKGLAASVTVVLVGWLGVDAVWGLMSGWATLSARARWAARVSQMLSPTTMVDWISTPSRSAAVRTFSISIATVIGPTPPGTGEIAPATDSTSS